MQNTFELVDIFLQKLEALRPSQDVQNIYAVAKEAKCSTLQAANHFCNNKCHIKIEL